MICFGLIYVAAFPLTALEIIKYDHIFFLWFCTVIYLGDSGAYLLGTIWGRRKLFPNLSPNKSLEGIIGALVGATFGGSVFWYFLLDHFKNITLSLFEAVVLSILLAALGIWGDLFESMFKRYSSISDSGSLIPGHGGALDRLDSLYLASPFLLIYIKFLH